MLYTCLILFHAIPSRTLLSNYPSVPLSATCRASRDPKYRVRELPARYMQPDLSFCISLHRDVGYTMDAGVAHVLG
jgi:hypothetical protein